MQTMTILQMAEYIKSGAWVNKQVMRQKSEDFINKIGLYRMLFKFDGDPDTVMILDKQVWTKLENKWYRYV